MLLGSVTFTGDGCPKKDSFEVSLTPRNEIQVVYSDLSLSGTSLSSTKNCTLKVTLVIPVGYRIEIQTAQLRAKHAVSAGTKATIRFAMGTTATFRPSDEELKAIGKMIGAVAPERDHPKIQTMLSANYSVDETGTFSKKLDLSPINETFFLSNSATSSAIPTIVFSLGAILTADPSNRSSVTFNNEELGAPAISIGFKLSRE